MAKPKTVSRPVASATRPGFIRNPALAGIPLPQGDYANWQSARQALGLGYGDPEVHGPITTLQNLGDLSAARGTKILAGSGNPMPQAGTDVFLLDPLEYLLSQYDNPDIAARLRRELLDEGWGGQWYGSPYLGLGRPGLITYARPTDTLSGNTRATFLAHHTRPLASLMDVAASANPGQAARSMRHESIHALTDPAILRDGLPNSVPQAEVDVVAARQAPSLVGVAPITSRKELETLIQSGASPDEIMRRMERTQLEAALRYHLAPAELLPHLSDVQHYNYNRTGGLLRDLDRSGLDDAVDAWANAPEGDTPVSDQARQMYADIYHNSPGNTGLRERMTSVMNTALQYGVPATIATAAVTGGNQAQAGQRDNFSMVPTGDGKTFAFPDGVTIRDLIPPARDLGTPLSFTGEERKAHFAKQAERERFNTTRRETALNTQNQWDSLPENQGRVMRMAKEIYDQGGVSENMAMFRAAKEYELDRPVVSAQYVRDNLNPYYEGDAPVSLNYLISEAMLQRAIGEAMSGGKSFNPEEASRAVVANIAHGATGQYDEIAGDMQNLVMQALEAHQPRGEYSDNSGIAEEDFRQLEKQFGSMAPYMYPEHLQPNFDALRARELFSANTDNYEPTSTGAAVFGTIGGLFNKETGDAVGDSLFLPPAEARAKAAVYWYNRSAPSANESYRTGRYKENVQQTPEGYRWYREPQTNEARYYSHSSAMPSGVAGFMGGSTDRMPARLSAWSLPYTQDTFATTGQEKRDLGEVRSYGNRPVPVILKGLTADQFGEAVKAADDYQDASDSYLRGQYALATGGNATPLIDLGLNLGRNSGDVFTWPDAALSILTGGIGGAVSSMGRQAGKDMVSAAGISAAKSLGRNAVEEGVQGMTQSIPMNSAMGGSITDFVAGDMPSSLLQREDGTMADPENSPVDAGEVFNRNWHRRQGAMQGAMRRYREQRQPQ